MEYELSFFDFNYEDMRKLLRQKGGKQIHKMTLYKATYFQLCGEENLKKGMMRIRDENGQVTLTTKKFGSKFQEEYEVKIEETFDEIEKILVKGGLEPKLETKKYREKWSFPGCNEIVFDLWPGLPIVMEIDCTSREALNKTCTKLGLETKDGVSGSKTMHLYGIKEPEGTISFANYKKVFKPIIKKNAKLLASLTKKYYQQFVDM